MALSHDHIESKISAKIKICILSRAELLYTVCNEIPCKIKVKFFLKKFGKYFPKIGFFRASCFGYIIVKGVCPLLLPLASLPQ